MAAATCLGMFKQIDSKNLENVSGGAYTGFDRCVTVYLPSGSLSSPGTWRNSLSGRAVNVQNGGPPRQGTRVP